MTQPLTQIPNACARRANTRFLQWYDRIIRQYTGRGEIVRALEKKKEEIRSELPVNQRNG